MKTTLKKLAVHYNVSYRSLRSVIDTLDSSVIEVGKKGCTIHDIDTFEAAIAHLPRIQPESVSIELVQPDDADVIEAEIVEEFSDSQNSKLIDIAKQNHEAIRQVAELAGREHGKVITNAYRDALTEEVASGLSKANRDILGLLGKS